MTTSPWETRARSPSGWWARNVWICESWISAKSCGFLRLHDAAGQKVHPVLAGPLRRPQAGTAVPHAAAQARRVRLDPVGEHLEAFEPAEVTGRFAAYQIEQTRTRS